MRESICLFFIWMEKHECIKEQINGDEIKGWNLR